MGPEINDAERLMWQVVGACTDYDCCRYLMDTNCLFFPEMYRLGDREKETGERITHRDGLDPYIRTLEDVERARKLCGAVPWLSNFFLQSKLTGNLIKKTARIHTKRKLPLFQKRINTKS